MTDPVSEVARATQEVAKTTTEGIRASKQLGAFISRLVAEPADSIVGILADRLKYVRWERQVRLLERSKDFLAERFPAGLRDPRPLPPKLAIPILENATVEEDDLLQDMWARLLVSAADPDVLVRQAFVELIRQMESLDARLLEYVSRRALAGWARNKVLLLDPELGPRYYPELYDYGVAIDRSALAGLLNCSEENLLVAFDNLMRLRCLKSSVTKEDYPVVDAVDQEHWIEVYRANGYRSVCITPLGAQFLQACGNSTLPLEKQVDSLGDQSADMKNAASAH